MLGDCAVKINEIFGGQRPSEFNASDYTADQLKGYKVDKSGKLVKDVSGGQMRKDVRTGIGNQIAGYFGRGKSEPTWYDKRDDLYKQALEQKDQAFLTSIDSKIAKGEKITPQEKAQADTIRAKLKQAPLPDDVVEPATAVDPETDISQTVPAGKQFRFQNPDLPGTFIIIRQDGYFQDRISKNLAGQVKKVNGLYPVLRPDNITKYNQYYNQAADMGQVREEPVHAL